MDGYVKLNTDGSSHGNPRLRGGKGILRDPNGDVVFAFAKYYGSTSSPQAEARALYTGLEICASKGLSQIVVETDSKLLWGILVSKSISPSSICSLIQKIRCFDPLVISVIHCFREVNMVADSLASFSIFSGSFMLFQAQQAQPKLSRALVHLDRLGVCNFRLRRR